MAKKKTTKKTTKKKTNKIVELSDYEKAAILAQRVNLESIKLLDCGCKYSMPGSHPKYMELGHYAEGHKSDDAKLHIEVGCRMRAYMAEDDAEREENPALRIQATYLLVYQVSSFRGVNKDIIQTFADQNGIFNAWPLWREFAHNMTGRFGLPPFTMPSFKVNLD